VLLSVNTVTYSCSQGKTKGSFFGTLSTSGPVVFAVFCYFRGAIPEALAGFWSQTTYYFGRLRTLTRTAVLPLPAKPRRSAAALETSSRRPATFGPRSFTRKTKER